MKILTFLLIVGVVFIFIIKKRETKNVSDLGSELDSDFSYLWDSNNPKYRMFPHIDRVELSKEQALKKIELITQQDDFDGTTLIHFDGIAGDDGKYLPMYFEKIGEYAISHLHIGISFSIFQGRIFLDIYSNVDEMDLAKDDQMIFIFENGDKIDVKFKSGRSSGVIKSNSYQLTDSELDIFEEQKLEKWKLISSRRNSYVVGDNSFFYELCHINKREIAQDIIRFLAKTIKYTNLKHSTQQRI